jgi:lysozyme
MFMSGKAKMNLRQREKKVMRFYDDGGKSGAGHCTYGYGTLAHKGPCTDEELTTEVTEEMVTRSFDQRLREAERAVARNIAVELTQEQFDALVSLTYNAGPRGAKDVYKLVNAGDFEAAADLISRMIYSRQKRNGKTVPVLMRGLIPRREEESTPFRTPKAEHGRSAAK